MQERNPSATSENMPAAGDAWFTPGRFALILGVLIFASYPEVITGIRTFFYRDFGLFGYPLANYHRESFWRGEIPLWNPLSNCGLPFLAQWNTLVLYPGSLFYLLFPLSWSLAVHCLLHQFWAGLGMYFLAHRWTANRFAAAVAGVVFACNGLTTNCLMWPNNIAALGWMPWVVLAAERAWTCGGRWLIAAAVFGTCQMLAGAPEIFLLTWLLLSAIGLLNWVGRRQPQWPMLLRFASAVALIALLSMPQWLPFADLLAHSHRDENFANINWSMPLWGWANFLVPAFRCFSRQGILFHDNQYWTSSFYLGIGTALLAICAFAFVRNNRVWLTMGIGGIGSVLALGDQGHLYAWLHEWIPQMGYVRFPIKFVVLTVFATPLLVAFAVRHYSELCTEKSEYTRRLTIGISLGMIVVVALIVGFSFTRPMEGEQWKTTALNGLVRGLFLVSFAGTVISLNMCRTAGKQTLIRLGLVVVTWLDLLTHTPRQNPTISPGAYAPGVAAFSPKQPAYPHSRALLTIDAENTLRRGTTEDPQKDFLVYRRGLFDNVNLLEGIAQVHGFYSLYLRETERVRKLFVSSDQPALLPLADFLGVSQITAPGKFIDWESRTNYLPWVSAGQTPVFSDAETTLRRLIEPTFSPRKTVYLPVTVKGSTQSTSATDLKIVSSCFAPHRIQLEVQTDTPSMIVLAQSYYHSWHAYVNGERVPLWRANYAFQALEFPPGHHIAELIYEDNKFYLSVLVSWLAQLSCVAAWYWRRRTKAPTRCESSTARCCIP